jgi:hypothetical protein
MPGGDESPQGFDQWRGWLRAGLLVLLIAGCAVFIWRGPVRASMDVQHDFALIYSSARAWLVGADPYCAESVRCVWLEAGGPIERDPMGGRTSTVLLYPPPAFVVLAPIAAMPWRLASGTWVIANVALYAASIWAVAWLAWGRRAGRAGASVDGGSRQLAVLAFVALAVWLAPAATNGYVGQTAVLTMFLIVTAYVVGVRGRRGRASRLLRTEASRPLAAALLGAATALKPQMALLFVVYEAGRRRWTMAAGASAMCVMLFVVGAARMDAAGVDWWASWQGNLSAFTEVADGDPTRRNAIRHHIVNLHLPLHNFTDNREVVKMLVVGILAVLSLGYLAVDLRRGRERGEGNNELLSLSMVSVVSLLIVYHRFYDAVLLLFPLALAVKGIAARA